MGTTVVQKAFDWVSLLSGDGFLNEQEYCATRDVFQGRLDHLRISIERNGFEYAPLLIAVVGEIGNNAYDHNLGNWRDVPGVCFVSDPDKRTFVIADRGQGIRRTIQQVKEVMNDQEALRVAFTEPISGRAPEQRGNGLKFVKSVVENQDWNLECYSGNALIRISKTTTVEEYPKTIQGSITIIRL